MSPLARNFSLFGIACALTGGAWWLTWPQIQSPPPPVVSSAPVPRAEPWEKRMMIDLIHELESAATDQVRLEAAGRLMEIPAENVENALERVTLVRDRKLTLVAKVLLIRWATTDGEAACRWAWRRFRSDGLWESAFREMGPSWAGRHPKSLEKWSISHFAKSAETISMQTGLASDEPVLEFDMLSHVSKWLILEDPRAAFEVLQARGGFSTDDRLPESLQTVEEIRHALLAFDDLDKMTPNRFTGPEIWAQSLFVRWRKIDPEDFSRSPYSRFFNSESPNQAAANLPDDLESALDQADQLPPALRQSGLVRAFDAWTKAHPGEPADRTGWPAARAQVWDDLEALLPHRGNDF